MGGGGWRRLWWSGTTALPFRLEKCVFFLLNLRKVGCSLAGQPISTQFWVHYKLFHIVDLVDYYNHVKIMLLTNITDWVIKKKKTNGI